MSSDDPALLDMLGAAREAVEYATSVDESRFLSEKMRQRAVERTFEIVGEAAKRVSDGFRAAHPEIPWRRAAGLRDVIAHEYDRVNYPRIYEIARDDLPDLIRRLEEIAPQEDG